MEYETIDLRSMTPDSGAFDYQNGAAEYILGSVINSKHDILVPKIRELDGVASTMSGLVLNTSRGLRRVFICTDSDKLYMWTPNTTVSTLIDVTDLVGNMVLDPDVEFFKWGNWYIASPRNALGTGAELLKYEIGVDAQFVRFQVTADKPTGRFISRIGSHALLCDIWNPVSAARERNGYFCSARRDITSWTAGTNRSVFGDINTDPENNDIIGVEGWNKFAVMWTKTGLHRLTLRGGATLFDLDQIGGGEEVMFGRRAIKHGKNAFYMANDGPRLCVNGEETIQIADGIVSRYFTDRSYSPYAVSSVLNGYLDTIHGLVYWIVECIGFPNEWFIFSYSIKGKSWSIIPLGDSSGLQAPASFTQFANAAGYDVEEGIHGINFGYPDHGNPFWNLVLIPDAAAGTWRIHSQSIERSAGLDRETYPVTKFSKVWRPADYSGGHFIIKKLRPIFEFDKNSGSDEEITVTLHYGSSPDTSDFRSVPFTTNSDNIDSQYFIKKEPLPITCSWCQVQYDFPSTSYTDASYQTPDNYPCLKQFSGVEIGFDLQSEDAS